MHTTTSLPTAMTPDPIGRAASLLDAPTMPAGSAELSAGEVRVTYHRRRGALDWGTLMKYLTTGLDTQGWQAGTATDHAAAARAPQRPVGLADLATDPTVAHAVSVAHQAALPLTLSETGRPAALATDVELLARQILRHGLAQAVAEAGVDGRVVVRTVWDGATCELRIHTFAGHDAASTGRDPAIMHGRLADRVTAAGGRYVATPTAAGYLTRAVLPVSAVQPTVQPAVQPAVQPTALAPYAAEAASEAAAHAEAA